MLPVKARLPIIKGAVIMPAKSKLAIHACINAIKGVKPAYGQLLQSIRYAVERFLVHRAVSIPTSHQVVANPNGALLAKPVPKGPTMLKLFGNHIL